ncbi:MAG: hypothetical protein KA010_01105 [Saprospiraceae bacterium]|nr:hypothetical protein [Saprospiraceae bacterium]
MKPISQNIRFLLLCYTFAIGFIYLIHLPFLGDKVKLTEVIFVPLFLSYVSYLYDQKYFKYNSLYLYLIIWLFGIGVSLLFNFSFSFLINYFAIIYLFILAMILSQSADEKLINSIFKVLIFSSLLNIVACLCSYAYQPLITNFETLQYRDSLLYFNKVFRFSGFTGDPNMLASQLVTSTLLSLYLFYSDKVKNLNYKYYFIILLLGLIFTFSKSIITLFIGVGIILLHYKKFYSYRNVIKVFILFLFIVQQIISNFYITNKPLTTSIIQGGGSVIDSTALCSIANWKVYPTGYYITKRTSMAIINDYFPVGIGLEQQQHHCNEYISRGIYPAYFVAFDSHCSLLGLTAETGLLGTIGLMLLLFIMLREIRKNLNTKIDGQRFIIALILLLALIEGLNIENFTFRHHWVMLGLFLSFYNGSPITKLKPFKFYYLALKNRIIAFCCTYLIPKSILENIIAKNNQQYSTLALTQLSTSNQKIGIYTSYAFNIDPKHLAAQLAFDGDGIARQMLENITLKGYNPHTVAYFALVNYNQFLRTHNDSYLETTLKHAKFLTTLGQQHNQSFLFYYQNQVEKFELYEPFISGLAQAVAVSLFVRMYIATQNHYWLNLATQAAQPLLEGSLVVKYKNKFDFIEEYPSTTPSYVLNGFLTAIISLLEYNSIAQSEDIAQKIVGYLDTLQNILGEYKIGGNYKYSLYDFTFCNMNYLGLYHYLWQHLYEITGNNAYKTIQTAWGKDIDWRLFRNLNR